MDHFLSADGGPLIPGALALVLLILIIKVVNALVRLVALAVLIAVLVGGYAVYGDVRAIQKAAAAATQQGQRALATALANAVGPPARQAIASVGLKPAFLRIHVVCAGPNTSVQLRYADRSFLFGVVSHQTVDVPLGDSARC
jgi:hypothetical protein